MLCTTVAMRTEMVSVVNLFKVTDPQYLFKVTAHLDPEWHYLFDILHVDGGPWQQLAARSVRTGAETPCAPVSDAPSTVPDAG